MVLDYIGEIGPLLFMAIALGLDGFSVSLSIGIQQIRLKRVALIGCIIGAFHLLLPFVGMVIGNYLSIKLEYITSLFGGFILVFIGCYMIFSALQKRKPFSFNPYSFQIFSLAFIVSIDSFPIGLSLGLSGIKTIAVIILFGITAMLFAWTGMLVGRKVHKVLGIYSELFGGLILLAFGLHGIF